MIPTISFLQITVLSIIHNSGMETISGETIRKILKEKYKHEGGLAAFYQMMVRLENAYFITTKRIMKPGEDIITRMHTRNFGTNTITYTEYSLTDQGRQILKDVHDFNTSLNMS